MPRVPRVLSVPRGNDLPRTDSSGVQEDEGEVKSADRPLNDESVEMDSPE